MTRLEKDLAQTVPSVLMEVLHDNSKDTKIEELFSLDDKGIQHFLDEISNFKGITLEDVKKKRIDFIDSKLTDTIEEGMGEFTSDIYNLYCVDPELIKERISKVDTLASRIISDIVLETKDNNYKEGDIEEILNKGGNIPSMHIKTEEDLKLVLAKAKDLNISESLVNLPFIDSYVRPLIEKFPSTIFGLTHKLKVSDLEWLNDIYIEEKTRGIPLYEFTNIFLNIYNNDPTKENLSELVKHCGGLISSVNKDEGDNIIPLENLVTKEVADELKAKAKELFDSIEDDKKKIFAMDKEIELLKEEEDKAWKKVKVMLENNTVMGIYNIQSDFINKKYKHDKLVEERNTIRDLSYKKSKLIQY